MKCNITSVPGYADTSKIKNPGLETKFEQLITAFHSTDQKFTKFKNPQIGFHFAATKELAHNAALKGYKRDPFEMEVKLGIKSPLVVQDPPSNGWYGGDMLDRLFDQGVISAKEHNKYWDMFEKYEDSVNSFKMTNEQFNNKVSKMFKNILRSKGYDSIKYWNTFDAGLSPQQLETITPGENKGEWVVKGEETAPDWSYIVFDNKHIEMKVDKLLEDTTTSKDAGGSSADTSVLRYVGNNEPQKKYLEYVHVDDLDNLRGNYGAQYSNNSWSDLKSEIAKEGGLTEPIMLKVNRKNRTAEIGEGNHRITAAKEMGYKWLPVWVNLQDNIGSVSKHKRSDVIPSSDDSVFHPAYDAAGNRRPQYLPGYGRPSRYLSDIRVKPFGNK
jgi:hypothetical protein